MDNPTPPPLPDGSNGQGPNGRFLPGNKLGKGNPANAKSQRLRAAVIECISEGELVTAARKILAKAHEGDRAAFAELMDRVCGKPVPIDLVEAMGELEARLDALEESREARKAGRFQPLIRRPTQ